MVPLGSGVRCRKFFLRPHQILDIYHVRDRLTQVATARWGTSSALAAHRKAWVKAQFAAIKKGRWQQVVKILERWHDCEVAQGCIRYFFNQQDRMNYPYYRRKGWCCSSAVIESACKQILGGRIKGSGRRWNVAGANAMITLRCAFANGEGKRSVRETTSGQYPEAETAHESAKNESCFAPCSLGIVRNPQKCPTHPQKAGSLNHKF